MQQTIDEIVVASDLPLSIIIVGLGDADFEAMDMLDADISPLYSKKLNKNSTRDIVQFVPFRRCSRVPVRLAREVLAEVPKQMT